MPTIGSSGKQSIDTIHWVGWADQDYLAARILLLNGLVVQGTALACTAVEKYLKGVCTLSGIPFRSAGHDVSKLNGMLHHRSITLGLNAEFLRFLNTGIQIAVFRRIGSGIQYCSEFDCNSYGNRYHGAANSCWFRV
jgi:hypothetical protein